VLNDEATVYWYCREGEIAKELVSAIVSVLCADIGHSSWLIDPAGLQGISRGILDSNLGLVGDCTEPVSPPCT
jgi:hypothetical protein